jgi:predicted amidophosphoribosyltransferase
MARCEDYPCCGHEPGDCPTIDSKGNARFTCVECGKRLPLKARSSICPACARRADRRSARGDDPYGDHDHSMDY